MKAIDAERALYEVKRGCEGKAAYSSERIAKRVRREMRRRYGNGTTIYRCRYCNCWHLTTRRGRKDGEEQQAPAFASDDR